MRGQACEMEVSWEEENKIMREFLRRVDENKPDGQLCWSNLNIISN